MTCKTQNFYNLTAFLLIILLIIGILLIILLIIGSC